jgi:hypothetical protein
MEKYRIIKTGLKTQKECDILDGVFGQLSDGMWENSRAAGGYWPYIDAEVVNGEVVLKVSTAYRKYDEPTNKLLDMDDVSVKKWLAKKIKQVIKEEGLDWKRDNEDETDYLDTKWRKSKQPSTVADCYYVYEVLKGRNVAKHQEYAKKMNISDALKTLDDAKIKYVQQEDEPWESDLDESAISWPLLSEAVLTPEQKVAKRLRAKARRAKAKIENQPQYFRIFQKMGDLGHGWWREGKPEPPEYRAYPNKKQAQEALRGLDWNVLERGGSLKWDPGDETGFGWRIEMTEPRCINLDVLKLLDADLAKGYKESIHSRYDLD